ncbi:MAG: DUF4242 domain-containing protein [Saprospiraceae bacterium]|nr:DUF4242 domain-containing protein [Saprospiraceae bacterium]
MPIFMDRHDVPGISLGDAAQAHLQDISFQKQFDCECLTYWVDEQRGNAFCLIKAPNIDAVKELHNQSHGLIPHAIIEVDSDVVNAFLGRIQDPEPFTYEAGTELSIFNDPAFRTILVMKPSDDLIINSFKYLNSDRSDNEQFYSRCHNLINQFKGRIVEDCDGIIASFASVTNALECSILMIRKFNSDSDYRHNGQGISIGIHAGVPVGKHKCIFGDALQMAKNLCFIASENSIYATSIIKELYKGSFEKELSSSSDIIILSNDNEEFLSSLMDTLAQYFHDETFGRDNWSEKIGVSKSKLYRKIKLLTDKTPNELLKEYRLQSALKSMLHRKTYVSQAAFDAGFQSPSYFTKCFKKRYGLLPNSLVKNVS